MGKWLSPFLYFLIALISIFLLLPLLMGMISESKCKKIVQVINNTTPVQVKIVDYKRGWFDSDATAQITLDKLDLENQELLQLGVTAKINHGPLLINWARFSFAQSMVDAKVCLNAAQNRLLNRPFGAEPIATAKVKFKLSGNANITLDSPPLVYQGQKNSFNWRGLKIKSKVSYLFDQLQSNIDFAGIDIGFEDHSFHLGQVTSFYHGTKTSHGLWIGDRNLKIASFALKNTNNRIFSLGNLNLHTVITEATQDTFNLTTELAVNNLNINGATYSQSKLNFDINGLNQITLINLQKQLISDKKISFSQLNIGLDTLLALINNCLEINIKQFNSTTPWGKLIATIKIIFNGHPNHYGLIATIFNSSIDANIKSQRHLVLHIFEKFYQKVPAQDAKTNATQKAEELLQDWQESGKITTSEDDNYLHMKLDYKDNQLLINDKQLTFTTIT